MALGGGAIGDVGLEAVLSRPSLREHLVSKRAVVLFAANLERVVWTNAQGVRLLGAPSLRALQDATFDPRHALIRQLRPAATRVSEADEGVEASGTMRTAYDFRSRLVPFTVRRVDGDVLLVTEELQGRSVGEDRVVAAAVDVLEEADRPVAVMTANGAVFATRAFGERGLDDDAVRAFVDNGETLNAPDASYEAQRVPLSDTLTLIMIGDRVEREPEADAAAQGLSTSREADPAEQGPQTRDEPESEADGTSKTVIGAAAVALGAAAAAGLALRDAVDGEKDEQEAGDSPARSSEAPADEARDEQAPARSRRWFYKSRRDRATTSKADPQGASPLQVRSNAATPSEESLDAPAPKDLPGERTSSGEVDVPDQQTGGDRIEGSGEVFVPDDASGGRTTEDVGSAGPLEGTDVTTDLDDEALVIAPADRDMPILDRDVEETDGELPATARTSAADSEPPADDSTDAESEVVPAGRDVATPDEPSQTQDGSVEDDSLADADAAPPDEAPSPPDEDASEADNGSGDDDGRQPVGFLGRAAAAVGAASLGSSASGTSALGASGLVRTVRHSPRESATDRTDGEGADDVANELALNEAEGGTVEAAPEPANDTDGEAGFREPDQDESGELATLDGAVAAETEASGGVEFEDAVSRERERDERSVASDEIAAGADARTQTAASVVAALSGAAVAIGPEPDMGGSGEPDEQAAVPPAGEPETSQPFAFAPASKPTRFVWSLDAERRFTAVSAPLAAAVGPRFADLEGRRWEEVAERFGFDEDGAIRRLLDKGDTWSGRTVLWPVQGADQRVPVDLAGLPAFDRERRFAGFNGFGIARTADAVPDTDPPEADDGDANVAEADVVELDERRRELAPHEQQAFAAIGERLTDENDAEPSPASADEDAAATEGPDADAGAAIVASPSGVEQTVRNGGRRAGEEATGARVEAASSAQQQPIPSAFAGIVRVAEVRDVDTSILARLPIPVLAYRADTLLFANAEFFRLTRYASLHELADAGGLLALFGDEEIVEGASIYDREGHALDVEAHLQRVPWDRERATLLTLRRGDERRGGFDASGDGDDDDGDGGKGGGDADRGKDGDQRGPSPLAGSGAAGSGGSSDKRLSASAVGGTEPSAGGETDVAETIVARARTAFALGSSDDPFARLDHADLRNILDTATDGVVVLDDRGRIETMNRPAEALFDVEAAELAGQPFTSLLAPESHRAAEDYLSGLSGTGVACVLNDGREVIGRVSRRNGGGGPDRGLVPLFLTIGRLDGGGHCAVLRDITVWKRSEEELVTARAQAEEASGYKTQFLSTLSHEIRTPLNAILGFSDLMLAEQSGPIGSERYRGYVRDIRRSGEFIHRLVTDLLDISKIEAGRLPLDFQPVPLNVVVTEMVAMAQPQANAERVIIRTSLGADLPAVVADDRSMRQVTTNLLSNALRFTEPGGQVIVSTTYDDGEVWLRVRDTGIGMSEEEVELAMQPFQQIGSRERRDAESGGTGLGLPLTKVMVEANRARFSLSSRPNEGTLVEVRFPPQRVLVH